MPIRIYRDLDVYKESYAASIEISKRTRKFPQVEQVELARQLRRSARSVAANIVEGWAKRHSAPEFKRYLQNAIGSCHETRHWLDTCKDEGYISADEWDAFVNRYNRIGAMLQNLWKNWRDFK